MVFADASALVKRYVRERHSAFVRRLLASGPVAVSRLSEIEVPSALARLTREGRLSARARDRAIKAFAGDVTVFHIIELTPAVAALAQSLLVRHDLRTGDAIQLASALWFANSLPLDGLLAFDTRLVTATAAERVPVLRPGRRASPLRN